MTPSVRSRLRSLLWATGRRRRCVLIVVVLLLAMLVEARLFVFPATDTPVPADVVVMFNGPGERTAYTWELADDDGLASTVMVSVPDTDSCTYQRPWIEEICFTPDPATTRGEARAIAELADEREWDDLLVVTTASQSIRARLRLGRCYGGDARFVTVREDGLLTQMMRVAYENAALVKALVFEREC